ncbi:response regulator [Patescibacteria group bacterium]|nr:response regulator [Patescibacteria group bacterium]MBU1877167.1 response regulator [Patescibacteria group bacterium]
MKKILIIEDESALQKSLSDVLSQDGYHVNSALDGETGFKLAQSEKPDLVLLDLVLPKLHGLEVLKKIRENIETKKIPVVILTNLESMQDIEKTMELGATNYLIKANYSLKDLLIKIKEILGE